MIYVTVAGENSAQLCGSLGAVLGRMCHVARLEDGLLTAQVGQPELLLWQCSGDITVHAPRHILIFAQPARAAARIEVDDGCVVVAAMEDEAAAGYAARRGLRLLDCGLSSKASLTFSSIGVESGVVALQRSVIDLDGNSVEPLELPLGLHPKPYYPMLAAVGVLLLGGMCSRLQKNGAEIIKNCQSYSGDES